MKRVTSTLALSAFLVALTAPLALAAANPAPKSGEPTHMKAMTSGTEHKTMHKEMVDLNSATKDELMRLPGMTDATADKIISGRPFKSRMDLVRKNIVTKEEYAKIRTEVTAKQAGGEKSLKKSEKYERKAEKNERNAEKAEKKAESSTK